MSTYFYFAYGSNLLNERLQNRCPTAQPIATAFAPGYNVNFGKIGHDDHGGSGKGTIFKTNNENDRVYGVVYEMHLEEATILDRIEGIHLTLPTTYIRDANFMVQTDQGQQFQTVTYIADPDPTPPKPYTWYWALCLSGAIQNDLPKAHQDHLASFDHMPDPDPQRPGKLEAEMLLKKSGFDHLLTAESA